MPAVEPLEFDADELSARLAAAKPGDTVLGMFFSGIVKDVAARGQRERAAELREKHGRGGWNDLKAYPVEDFLRLIFDVVEDAVAKGAARGQALRDVGFSCTRVFFGTLTGKVLLTLWARGGPAQLVPNIAKAYATSVNIGRRSYEPVSPTCGKVQFRDDVLPPLFCEGTILAAFDAIKAHPSMSVVRHSPFDVDFVIDWSAHG